MQKGNMRMENRYGYLIDALRRYPFNDEIKKRIEEITVSFPYQQFDENWYIKSKSSDNTPTALKNIIKQESDPILIRLFALQNAIKKTIKSSDPLEWTAIKSLYIEKTKNAEGIALELFISRASVYRNIITPFFKKLEIEFIVAIRNKRCA